MPQIFLAAETAVSRSLPLSAQRIINLFVERQNPMAKAQSPIFGVPGLTTFALEELGSGPVRGGWVFQGKAYFVSGFFLYQVAESGAVTNVSGIEHISGTGAVDMSDNGIQMGLVNGSAGWMYDEATGLRRITDANFHASDTITFMDGYFVFGWKGTNEFFLSKLYDGMTYSGNDTAVAEAQPGYVVAVYAYLQFLYVFCTSHIEIWYDAGSASFPFQRYAGGVIPYGTVSPASIIEQEGSLYFLGVDRIVYRIQGNNIERISNHEVEHMLASVSDLSGAEVVTYTLEGHKFVKWTIPGLTTTIAYDISSQKWHERVSYEGQTDLEAWRGRVTLNCYQKTLVGDRFSGKVGYVDWSTYTEYGENIRGLVHSAPLHADRMRVFVSRFELDIQAGVGNQLPPGDDPQIMLRYSQDGGYTWSEQQLWRSMGEIGQYLKRLRWLRMGQARQWVFEIVITDPVPRVIIAAHATIEQGMT